MKNIGKQNKPYVNGVSLGEQNKYLKCYQTQTQRVGLSKEILYIFVGQGAAKLQAVKRKILPLLCPLQAGIP